MNLYSPDQSRAACRLADLPSRAAHRSRTGTCRLQGGRAANCNQGGGMVAEVRPAGLEPTRPSRGTSTSSWRVCRFTTSARSAAAGRSTPRRFAYGVPPDSAGRSLRAPGTRRPVAAALGAVAGCRTRPPALRRQGRSQCATAKLPGKDSNLGSQGQNLLSCQLDDRGPVGVAGLEPARARGSPRFEGGASACFTTPPGAPAPVPSGRLRAGGRRAKVTNDEPRFGPAGLPGAAAAAKSREGMCAARDLNPEPTD